LFVQKNPVHSVFFLILAFFNASGLFILTGAEFLAMILVLVYVGAVAVLFLFVIMMLGGHSLLSKKYRSSHDWKCFFKSLFQLFICISIVIILNSIFIYILTWWTNIPFQESVTKFCSSPLTWFDCYVIQSLVISLLLTKFIMYKILKLDISIIIKNFLRTFPVNIIITLLIFSEFVFLSFLWNSSVIASEFMKEPSVEYVHNTESLGMLIYTEYFLMFQIGGMILLLAMIGAISLTLNSKKSTVLRQNIIDQLSRTKQSTLSINKVESGKGVNIK
jgi:NADH-quinone oxidoreductase subunit J